MTPLAYQSKHTPPGVAFKVRTTCPRHLPLLPAMCHMPGTEEMARHRRDRAHGPLTQLIPFPLLHPRPHFYQKWIHL